MANYIPTGSKRDLTPDEIKARMIATGYNYIPTGGLPPEPVVVKPVIAKPPHIQKPVIAPLVKPGKKIPE